MTEWDKSYARDDSAPDNMASDDVIVVQSACQRESTAEATLLGASRDTSMDWRPSAPSISVRRAILDAS